ncbi:hypothetical protein ACO0RG_002749 [Hanseniaspora osmophila]|mgnify:CR=1 FL=1|uniref:Mitochondrial import inner membrane translocase subunit TIM50 n=1 Tax=Hanseniaspora osmophila TaxID=56408 RepID=A0A1E5R811_9ASCO|nr:Mitochondrial import inner membrane translocase subunit TIM50 [Hanseniaspora osmophila]
MLSVSKRVLSSNRRILCSGFAPKQISIFPRSSTLTTTTTNSHRDFHFTSISRNENKSKQNQDNSNDMNKKDSEKPSSILNDDLLVKAGFDVDAAGNPAKTSLNNEKADAQSNESVRGEASEDTANEANSSKEHRRRRKRVSSTDIKREKMSNMFYVVLLGGGLGLGLYMGREWEPVELEQNNKKYAKEISEIESGYTPMSVYQRAKLRFDIFVQSFNEPPFDDLLPPPPPPPYQRPLTLVIGLEDLLVHSEWTNKGGWKTLKRPGVEFFLGYLSQYYEIVLFSNNSMMYGEPIIQKIDPIQAFVAYSLYKEHCVYKDGDYVKDLSKLNRDVGKVIVLDCNAKEVKLQPDNLIPLKPWTGEQDNGALLDLIPFLEYIVTQNVSDVRPVLNSFKDKAKLPEEFNKRVESLREKFYKDQHSKQQAGVMKLLGVATGSTSTAKFPLDFIREEGLNNYKRFIKLVEEEKEKIEFKQQRMKQTFTLDQYLSGQLSQEEIMKQQLAKDQELEQEFVKYKAQQGEK